MQNEKKIILWTAFFIILTLLLPLSSFAEDEDAERQEEQNLVEAARVMRSTGRIQMNFKDLEMAKFIRFMSELFGESIVVDGSVGGKVSIVSPKPLSLREAREVMVSVLEMNNLAIQDMGGYSKVVPLSAGPSISNTVVRSDESVRPGDKTMTQVVPLKYVKAGFVVPPLKAAIPNIQAVPLNMGASVLLSGKAALLNRAASVIRAIDAPDSIRTIKIYPLEYANPKLIEAHFNALAKDVSSKLGGMMAIGDERTRRLILVGSSQSLREAERLLKQLDVSTRTESFHIYKLKNADAKTVAEQLSQILAVSAKSNPAQKGAAPTPSTVVPDLPTNSLIFMVSQEKFESIKSVLDQLDTQPKQVLLRGLIAEVNLNKLNSAGIDWAAWGGAITGDAIIAGQGQLGMSGVPAPFLQLFERLTTEEVYHPGTGGANGTTTTHTEGKGLIYAYVKLLNKFDAINVLSMPRLLCTDNLQSHLQVGQVIPQLKGSLTDSTNPGAVANSYEYKDVGLILTVTPHIRSGNLVSLEIEQRIEDLVTTQGSATPITSKREIKTNVLVANGETVILGGLIKEAEKALRNRVPILSYIPLIGNLFTTREKQREKIDLMIFLTPYILETPHSASAITTQIINDSQAISDAEKKMLNRNATTYDKAVKKEAVERDLTAPPVKSKDEAEENKPFPLVNPAEEGGK